MPVLVREILVSDSSYFLRVDWSGRSLESGFLLLLTDGRDAWRGEVGVAELSSEAEELEMETERYVQDLQQALTGTWSSAPSGSGSAPSGSGSAPSSSSAPYSFTLTPAPPPPGAAVTLAYEKVQRDISFRLGSVLLDPDPDPVQVVRQVLVHSLQRGTSVEQENVRLETENRRLEGEHRRITQQLRRYAEGKEALEEELYSRFVLVLNQKKEKIRSLQETLAQQENSSGKKEATAGQEEEEEEEEDYGGSTDEEEQTTSSSSRGQCPASPLDDSLKDLTDVAPCRKRRHRHLEAPGPHVKRPNPPGPPQTRTNPAGPPQTRTNPAGPPQTRTNPPGPPQTRTNPAGDPQTRTRRAPPPGPTRTPHQDPADAADAEDLFEDF